MRDSGAMAGRNFSWKKRWALNTMNAPRVTSAAARGMPEVTRSVARLRSHTGSKRTEEGCDAPCDGGVADDDGA